MVGPSSSQLYLVRAMIELMLEQFSGKGSSRKDLDANTLQILDTFLKQSFYWPYLLDFSGTLVKCCDLSQLWYREFFLEITNGARIQFPIEMSLPWILTDHILKTQHAGFIECLLYPLDLYNDAAQCALNRFKRRFLYDEIEAEANLVFDQLVYKLSDQIFRHYKQTAASVLLEKRFRAEAQRVERKEAYPGPARYSAALLKQKHVQLLGRNVDLSLLLAQRMNKAVFKSLEYALQRFTSGDLTGIVELELGLECNRLCHRMLSEHLKLDDFDSLLEEANGKVVSPMAKSTVHIFWEIRYDLVKNYCYNDATCRFVPSKMPLEEVVQRAVPETVEPLYMWGSKSLNSCWEAICRLYRGFFGTPHLRAMCRILGYQGLFVITTELQKILKLLLTQTLHLYVTDLQKLMPMNISVPVNCQNNSQMIFAFYLQQLKPMRYETNLRMRTHQCLREVGNMMLLMMHLEKCLTMEDLADMFHAGPFIGQFPQILIPPISPKEGILTFTKHKIT
ncbi:Cytoplasmic FMR1-interacting protein 2 [Cichlidogyrus casuarinus]|uniref:Cytoplasmic FMR1-interacting protein 2 n=1 Tax=Cichlidogyrus casuarinus TaxID=1844966 RepID=A0ABD2PZY5_9PLAT